MLHLRAETGFSLVLLLALAGAGCQKDPAVTGLRVNVLLGGTSVDQLVFTVSNSHSTPIDHVARPGLVTGPLVGDQVVELYLQDSLAGTFVTLDVVGTLTGRRQAADSMNVPLTALKLVPVTMNLGKKTDAGTDGGDAADGRGDGPVDARDAAGDSGADADAAGDGSGAEASDAGSPLGTLCTAGTTCESGLCVDGVCCATTCGLCHSCNVPTKLGTCAPTPLGIKNALCLNQNIPCGFDGTCDGNGGCYRPQAGKPCKAASCMGTTLTPPAACDGLGTCQVPVNVACAPYVCDPTGTPHCRTDCRNSADCAPNTTCNNSSCGQRPKKALGAGCVADTDCASNVCADGVCCMTMCSGQCMACNLAGMLGTCRNVPGNKADPHNVCVDTGVASCGTNGLCNGNAGCLRYAAGTVCEAAQCTADTVIGAKRCDLNGLCAPSATTMCDPYRCNPATTTCFTSCTTTAECVRSTPNSCRGGMCR